ncbi:MAG: ATP-binding protein [Candidatus Paceibacterota bacterium]
MPAIIKIFVLGTILAGFSNLFFGLIIYFKNKKEKQNIIFLLLELSIVLWLFSYAIWLAKDNEVSALFWSRMLNLGATLIPVLFLHWVVAFLGLVRKKFLIFAYISTIIFSFFSFSSFYIQKVKEVSIFSYWPQAGWLYSIFLATFVIYFGYGFILLYGFIKDKSNNKERILQIKYIFLGSIISAIGGIFNFPLMYGVPLMPLTLTTIFHPIFWAYGILKHNLFNIKVVATEFLVIFLLVIFLVNIFFYTSIFELSFKIFIFIASTFLGIFIIRSVLKEVKTREEMEGLAWKLEQANIKLQELDKAKSDFVTIASHQLRTPITAIKGYASMVLEGSFGAVPEKAKVAVSKIFESSNRLVALINDFLNLSRIERGKMEYAFAKVNLKEMIETIFDEFKTINVKKKTPLDLSLKINDGDFSTSADSDKIRQTIYNLIDNAVKYTQKGFVKISLYKDDGEGEIIMKVEDSGKGMSKETLDNIFEKFARAKGDGEKYQVEGTGLGLYVAREIAKAHGGDVWAESGGLDKGSAFILKLPMDFITPEERRKKEEEEKAKKEKVEQFIKKI